MTPHGYYSKHAEDRLGRLIAGRLSEATNDLPHDITERLRAARVQAVARRKKESALSASTSAALAGTINVQLGNPDGGWWSRLTSALALLILVAGMLAISDFQDELRAVELAEIDAELLTDELPPSAYTDPGFAQYLRANPSR
jgi:hypothetical protein